MKIIITDNFDRDYVSDRLVAENVMLYYAPHIAELLNSKFGGGKSSDFFKAVDDDYKLKKWEP